MTTWTIPSANAEHWLAMPDGAQHSTAAARRSRGSAPRAQPRQRARLRCLCALLAATAGPVRCRAVRPALPRAQPAGRRGRGRAGPAGRDHRRGLRAHLAGHPSVLWRKARDRRLPLGRRHLGAAAHHGRGAALGPAVPGRPADLSAGRPRSAGHQGAAQRPHCGAVPAAAGPVRRPRHLHPHAAHPAAVPPLGRWHAGAVRRRHLPAGTRRAATRPPLPEGAGGRATTSRTRGRTSGRRSSTFPCRFSSSAATRTATGPRRSRG